jgi:hypothetical protein
MARVIAQAALVVETLPPEDHPTVLTYMDMPISTVCHAYNLALYMIKARLERRGIDTDAGMMECFRDDSWLPGKED